MSTESLISPLGLPTSNQFFARTMGRTTMVKESSLWLTRPGASQKQAALGFTKDGLALFRGASYREQDIAVGVARKLLRSAFSRYASGVTPEATRGVGIVRDSESSPERLAKLVGAYATSRLRNQKAHRIVVTVSGTHDQPALTLAVIGRTPSRK